MMLVIGAGVAGLSCALAALDSGAEVELVTPGSLALDAAGTPAGALAGGNTAMAQGGVAAAIGDGDRAAAHLADTLAAGVGLVDPAAAGVLTADGVRAVRSLLASGLPVDRDHSGAPLLGIEGAHGRPRIVHSGGDRTGAALHAHLATQVRAAAAAGRLTLTEYTRAESLILDTDLLPGSSGRSSTVVGARLRSTAGPNGLAGQGAATRQNGEAPVTERRADAVVLATGGYAALFPRTTNHSGARGEGILLAARAGALLADLEFVQFHPTVLPTGELVSEAVRGAGAVLLDAQGDRFMVGRHPLAELAPRDVVSREIHRVLRETSEESVGGPAAGPRSAETGHAASLRTVWLDATGIERAGGPGTLARAFPGITAAVVAGGFDWTREPIPVAPAAHYTMGGVASDLDGRSTVPGLFVAGEVASTGVHGANRLASNSLLEGLVFGSRAGRAAAAFAGRTAAGAQPAGASGRGAWPRDSRLDALARHAEEVRIAPRASGGVDGDAPGIGATTAGAQHTPGLGGNPVGTVNAVVGAALGIERTGEDLQRALTVCAEAGTDDATLAALICAAAIARQESRGAHQRADFPDTDPAQAHSRGVRAIEQRAESAGVPPGDPAEPSRPRVPGSAAAA